MKPAQKIQPPEWVGDKAVKAVMAALQGGEKSPQALFVGGCVRNTLLGREVEDVDIACVHAPKTVTERLEAAGLKAVPTGIEHGTVTAVADGRGFEITTLRKDIETDGRRATVAFTDDWVEDAKRRDFTINTLLLDMEGNVYDPTGEGLDHLHRRRIVFVGNARERIEEDYLRILRFFRFHAGYGQGEPDQDALKACRAGAAKVAGLSKERITQEFFKIIAAPKPAEVLRLMFDNDVLKEFSFGDLEILQKLCVLQDKFTLAAVPPRVFALAQLDLDNVAAMEKFILFPKVFQKDIAAIAEVLKLGTLDSEQKIKIAVYRHGRSASAQALLVQGAKGEIGENFLRGPLETAIRWDVPDFPVSGDDLMRAGIKPGPDMGRILEALENWWIEDGFRADKKSCLARL